MLIANESSNDPIFIFLKSFGISRIVGNIIGLNTLTVSVEVLQKIEIWQKCFSNQNLLLFSQVPSKMEMRCTTTPCVKTNPLLCFGSCDAH